jgi:hypothetical protein
LDSIGKGDLEIGWNDLARRERQRYPVAKTLKWGVLGGTKDVGLWFVGPDCGSCGVSGNRVWGGHEQEFGLRGSTDDERCKDEEEQGRAHINSVCGSSEDKSAWRENGLVSDPSLWPWARYRPGRGDSVYVADVVRATKCAGEMKIWLRVLGRSEAQKGG